MPTKGISLVGFLDQPTAIQHFRGLCVMPDYSDPALTAAWQVAHAKLGLPVPNAGHPDILPLPTDGQTYVAQLVQQQWVMQSPWAQMILGASWHLVEIDPLLAYQIAVDTDRSEQHGNGVQQQPPTMAEMLAMCLPMQQTLEDVKTYPSEGGLLITARNLNFQVLAAGNFGAFAGIAIGLSLPLVHVVRLNGRCYLHNGFHRAVAARQRGATHVPCLFRDVPDEQSVGIRAGTFNLPLLESANPPTVAHFTQGRALDVQLKVVRRSLHVSWSQYATSEE
jgi:hypothetical protein